MVRCLLKELRHSHQNKHYPFNLATSSPSNIFTGANHDTEPSWATLISTLAQGGCGSGRALALFKASKLLNSGAIAIDGYALVHLVRSSTDLGLEFHGQQLHTHIVKSGFGSNVFVTAALMRFYRARESMDDAYKVFVEIPQPNVVSWNSLISGCVQSGQFRKALGLFLQLDRSDVQADAYSFTGTLSACGSLGMLEFGRSIHCKMVKYGLECGIICANCLIDMYGKCASIEDAVWVFDEIVDKDVISWNSVISACARNQRLELAYSYFCQMSEPDTISYNELINGIAQFGDIEDAAKMLWSMPNPNSSSWNSIITGYVNRNRAREALEFFAKMHLSDVGADEYTYSVILSGIASLAALKWGMLIHCCAIKCSFDASVVVGSTLIDMYSKCGLVKDAESMFALLPEKNLVTWNAMISGFAHNGNSQKVIILFEELKMLRDLKPDSVTFLSVISACSNTEVPLQKVIRYFESMINDYQIEPTVEHCCSMIRLMGKRGEVWLAVRMIYDLSFGLCGMVWKTLLSACGASRNLKIAKIAAAKVVELEGDNDYVYVIMSNIFACKGQWADVSKVRKLMRERRVLKEVGRSWVEVEEATPSDLSPWE